MGKLLIVAGSTRTGAFSKQLAGAAQKLAQAAGHQATVVDLRDYPMPLYDGDLEAQEGSPEGCKRLRALVRQHRAFVFATPEYNASLPAVLKNAIDWLSRPDAQEPSVAAFGGGTAGLLASSPGALGGLRALVHLRQVCMNLGLLVVTEQFALGHADRAFGSDGALVDGKHATAVQNVLRRVLELAASAAAPSGGR
jgi:chromate reductase, NAD(P)H dehydrogenase (quinone)